MRNFTLLLIACGTASLLATTTAAQTPPLPEIVYAETLRAKALTDWFRNFALPYPEVQTFHIEIAETPPPPFPEIFRMRFDDETGAAEFYDEIMGNGTPFLSVGGVSGFDPWFVAKYRNARFPFEDYYLPSIIERVFYTPDFSGFYTRLAPLKMPVVKNSAPSGPYMTFTAIRPALPNHVEFDAAWTWDFEVPGNALDLYAKSNLLDTAWHYMTRFIATQSWESVSFTLDETTVFPGMYHFFSNMMHSPPPIVLGFNISTNPPVPSCPYLASLLPPNYVPGLVITNNIYAQQPAPRGFFKLGTLHDSDFDGLPDAYETLVLGTDPHDPDSDNDGILDEYDPNPLVWDNSLADLRTTNPLRSTRAASPGTGFENHS